MVECLRSVGPYLWIYMKSVSNVILFDYVDKGVYISKLHSRFYLKLVALCGLRFAVLGLLLLPCVIRLWGCDVL